MELVLADVRWLLMKELGPLPKETPDKPERPSDLLFEKVKHKSSAPKKKPCHLASVSRRSIKRAAQ